MTSILLPRPILATGILFAYQHCQQRVSPQLVVVIEVLIPQSQVIDPLLDQLFYAPATLSESFYALFERPERGKLKAGARLKVFGKK
jgi:hypothetical protein